MLRRLVGFDDRQLIKAMGLTSNAFFVIWRGGEPADFELKVEYRAK